MLKKIRKSVLVVFIVNITKRIYPPGFERLPLYDVLKFFFTGIQKGAITTRASSMAFSFFLALFPSVIFLFTLIPYIPIHHFQDELFDLIKQFMPKSAFEATQDTLEDIIKRQHGGLLSFGFIGALYFSTNGFNSAIGAFNSSYHAIETRSPLLQMIVSLLLVIIQTVLLLTAITLIIYSEILLHKLRIRGSADEYMIQIGRGLIIIALFFFTISFIYYLGPSKKTKFRFISAGSSLATLMMIITSLGFAYYVNNFGQYNKLYGSIGTLIVVLLWIYFNSIVLLLGFELNASIHNANKTKSTML